MPKGNTVVAMNNLKSSLSTSDDAKGHTVGWDKPSRGRRPSGAPLTLTLALTLTLTLTSKPRHSSTHGARTEKANL